MASESKPVVVNIQEEEKPLATGEASGQKNQEAEPNRDTFFYTYCGGNPATAAVTPALLVAGVVVVVCGFGALIASSLSWIAGIVAVLGAILGAIMICWYGGMKHQLDRFKRENARLQKTSAALEKDVDVFQNTNKQLGVQVDKLEGTVDELQTVSDALQKDLGQFAELRQSLDDFARETGTDIKQVIGDITGVYDKIYELTVDNERLLLQRIAQDLEFMDRDQSMSKNEFERFIQRIPEHLKERFNKMNKSFEDIAGKDMMIDHEEMKGLIDMLMNENATKKGKA